MTILTYPQKAKTAAYRAPTSDLWSEEATTEVPTSNQIGWGLALFPLAVLFSGFLIHLM